VTHVCAVKPQSHRLATSILATGLWLATLAFALWSFTPERSLVPFSSDDAISVLMANDAPVTAFHLFYFGQDRFGGWPHLALDALRPMLGPVTPAMFGHAQVLWAWLGAIPLWKLAGANAAGALVAYLAALSLSPVLIANLFSFQPYTWQIAALLWTWWLLRKVLSAGDATGPIAALAFAAALLSVWTSRASVPMVFFLAAVEMVRDRRSGERFATRHPLPVLVAVAATVSEVVLLTLHARYSRRHFGMEFRSPVRVDHGFYLQNLRESFARTIALPPGALTAVAVALGLCGLIACIVVQRRPRAPSAWEQTAWMGGCFSVIAAIQFALCVASNWARINDYSPRYFVFCSVFACLAIGVAVQGLANLWPSRAPWMLLLAGVGIFAIAWPRSRPAPDFASARTAASAIARMRPGAVVWGDYWSTYWLAGAAPEAGLRPVPFEGQYDRMPWLRDAFARADVVLAPFRLTDRFGTFADPTPILVDGGSVLELASTVVEGALPFALYRQRTTARPVVQVEDPAQRNLAPLFDGRLQTTAPLGELTLRYRCDGGSSVDVLGGDAVLQVWDSTRWAPVAATRAHRWKIARRPDDVRVRVEGPGVASEVVVLCDEAR